MVQPSYDETAPSDPAAVSDEDIVVRVLAGDIAAFELLMRRNNARVFRAARAIVGDHEAEDAMQEAYLAAFAHLASFDGRARFGTWLLRIAVNAALARKRGKARTPIADPDTWASIPARARDPECVTGDAELRAILDDAIDALPEPFRAVFVLRAVEELSVAETAAILEVPEETVRTRLFRAHRAMRDHLAPHLADDEQRAARRRGVLQPETMKKAYTFHLRRCDRVVFGVLARISPAAATG